MTPQQLKNSILQRAIEGRLVEQRPEEGTAKDLLKEIRAEKARLIEEGKIKKSKPLPPITEEEKPFEIPDGWEWVRLQDICLPLRYGTANKSDKIGKIPVLRMGNIQNGEIDYGDLLYSNDKDDIEKYSLNANDLLFNRTNSKEWVGKTAIYRGDRPAIFAGYLIQIRTLFVDALYLNFVMNSDYERNYCKRVKSDGINQSNVNGQKLARFIVPLPPLSEQHRIVSKIEELMPLIDKYDKAYTKLTDYNAHFPEAMKKSILQYAIQGKLVEQRPEEGTAKDLLREIRAEKARLIEEGKIKKSKPLPPITEEEKPFEIPEGWEWVRLGEIFTTSSGTTPQKSNTAYYDKADYNWVRTTDLNNGILKSCEVRISALAKKECHLEILPRNSVCIAMYGGSGTIGKNALIDFDTTINQSVFAIHSNDFCEMRYILYYMQSYRNKWMEFAAGSRRDPNINGNIIKNTLIPLPPLSEQHRIVSKIEELQPLCEKLVKSDAR